MILWWSDFGMNLKKKKTKPDLKIKIQQQLNLKSRCEIFRCGLMVGWIKTKNPNK